MTDELPRTVKEIRAWLLTELTADVRKKRNIDDDDFKNILRCLHDLASWYWEQNIVLGHFLTYVVKNDFVRASTQADSSNVKALDVFARFVYNRLPSDWRQKGQAL